MPLARRLGAEQIGECTFLQGRGLQSADLEPDYDVGDLVFDIGFALELPEGAEDVEAVHEEVQQGEEDHDCDKPNGCLADCAIQVGSHTFPTDICFKAVGIIRVALA